MHKKEWERVSVIISNTPQNPGIMEESTNYLGATIFWLYNILALVFTGKTLQTLYNLYTTTYQTKKTNRTNQLWLFSTLALISFATLSTTMLNVLIESFNQWKQQQQPSHSNDNLPLAIWHWSTTSSLFTDFAEGLVHDSARFFWAQTALLATLSTVIYMGTEGRQRQIPQLWTFFALSQILPISFAQNLFYLALCLTTPEEEEEELESEPSTKTKTKTKSEETKTKPTTPSQRILHYPKTPSILTLATYSLTLALAQLYAHTPALIPLVLLARLALLFPLLLPAQFYTSAAQVPDPKIKTNPRATADELQRVLLKTALLMTGLKGYQALQEGFGVGEVVGAGFGIRGHPAVRALGWDFLLCAGGFGAWNFLGPKVAAAAAGGVEKAGAPAVAAPAQSAKEKKREAKAARKSGGGVSGRR